MQTRGLGLSFLIDELRAKTNAAPTGAAFDAKRKPLRLHTAERGVPAVEVLADPAAAGAAA